MDKRALWGPLVPALLALAIWMTIDALSGGSKASIVIGGWLCFAISVVIGVGFMTVTGRDLSGRPKSSN